MIKKIMFNKLWLLWLPDDVITKFENRLKTNPN